MKYWTLFWDMNSGGTKKEKWQFIIIEASQEKAIEIFFNRFHHNPTDIACNCCGTNYAIYESNSLSNLTAYHRNEPKTKILSFNKTKWQSLFSKEKIYSIKEFENRSDVLIIRKK